MKEWIKTQDALLKAYRKTPQLVGVTAVSFYKQSFKRKGFIDRGYQRWKPTKKDEKGRWGKTGKKKNLTTLVQSGRLRRSIRIVSKSRDSVTVGTDVPYARIHNEGFKGTVQQRIKGTTVREHTRRGSKVKAHKRSGHSRTIKQNIPKRQFMGASAFLGKRIQRQIEETIKSGLKRI
ncbi:phage virion morphogenesis protein [Limibacter armeniacum]|uniref:phage virion morphogenesis protein n=1 Tax=Limibacter armeniacum TaxID=466084 RepID=UPI002FE65D06